MYLPTTTSCDEVSALGLVEDAPRHAKGELGRRVAEPTAELQEANERLQIELQERKRAEEAVREHAERLKILHLLDQAILVAQSPHQIAYVALRHVRVLVPYHEASVVLMDYESGRAVPLAAHPEEASFFQRGQDIPKGFVALARGLWEEQVYVVDDIHALSQPLSLIRTLEAGGVRSFIVVPLMAHNEPIGSLNLISDRPANFSPVHLEVAREIAVSLALGIQQSRLHEEVRAGHARLQALSRRLVEVQEAERRLIVRELHDEIGQSLTGLKLLLEMCARQPGNAGSYLVETQGLVNRIILQVRELSMKLRPAMLDDLGLLPTLLWHIERYMTQTSVRVCLQHNGLEGRRFPREVETSAYRIVQEALTNVARHARVSEVTLSLWVDQSRLYVQIEDPGVGFDPGALLSTGLANGLTGMKERASLLGGKLTLNSAPGSGTSIIAELPFGNPRKGRIGS